jgi:hypothetical protein
VSAGGGDEEPQLDLPNQEGYREVLPSGQPRIPADLGLRWMNSSTRGVEMEEAEMLEGVDLFYYSP